MSAVLWVLGKALAISVLAWLAGRLVMRGRPVAVHVIWGLAFVAMLTLPFLASSAVPKATIYVPSEIKSEPAHYDVEESGTAGGSVERATPAMAPPEEEAGVDWARILMGWWLVGALWVIGRSVSGLWSLRSLRVRASYALEPDDVGLDLGALSARVGVRRPWELRQSTSPELATAMTWGLWRPVVLLPEDADLWTAERREAVLLHELAHVRRRDFASQLLAEATCALYWFNPLVWFGARAMREAAEIAADRSVVDSGVKPSTYASELLQMAAGLGGRSLQLSLTGVSVMHSSKIESRIQSILSPARQRGFTTLQTLASVALAVVAVSALAGVQVTQQPGHRSARDKAVALANVKQLGLATMMYAADFDDVIPYAQSQETACSVIFPYIKNKKVYESPSGSGRFQFNLKVGGVNMADLVSPSESLMWIEPVKNEPAVAYMDGHAKIITADQKAEFAKALKQTFKRRKNSKPLPKNYSIKW